MLFIWKIHCFPLPLLSNERETDFVDFVPNGYGPPLPIESDGNFS